MELALVEPRPALVEDAYHLEIAPATGRYDDVGRYRERVNVFLDGLFNINDPENLIEAPLKYDHHRVLVDSGKNIVHMRLKLSPAAVAGGLSLEHAAERFCGHIFDPRAKGLLGVLTNRSILGFSAMSGVFQKHWRRMFFKDCLSPGPPLVSTIDRLVTKKYPYLPSWAMVFNFMTLLGLIPGTGHHNDPDGKDNSVTEAMVVAAGILSKFAEANTEKATSDEIERWNASRQDFKTHMKTVYDAMDTICEVRNRLITFGDRQGNAVQPHEDVCDALYQAVELAARTCTANRKMWIFFNDVRNASAKATIGSAFAVGGNFLGILKGKRTASIAEMVINGIGFGFNVVQMYYNFREAREATKMIDYHKKMIINGTATWRLASDTLTLLRWVDYMGGARPNNELDFVDDEARRNWEEFIGRVKQTTGELVGSQDLEADAVLLYLDEQSKALKRLRERLENDEPPIPLVKTSATKLL